MARNILVTATEHGAGQCLIAMAILRLMQPTLPKVGYFKPIGCREPGGFDPDACLIKECLELEFSMEEMVPVTMGEVRSAMSSGTYDQLLDTILNAYDKIASRCDFVVCQGTDYDDDDAMAAFEFDINADLSKNLGAEVLLVVDGAQCPGKHEGCMVIKNIEVVKDRLNAKGCEMFGAVIMGADPDKARFMRDAAGPVLSKKGIQLLGVVPRTDVPERHIDERPLLVPTRPQTASKKTTPKQFIHRMMSLAQRDKRRVVLPEGKEPRIIRAAHVLLGRGIVDLTLLGNVDEIRQQIDELGLRFDDTLQIIDPKTSELREPFAKRYIELRSPKKTPTWETAYELLGDASYFGTMMVQEGLAGGMVSGSITTTAATLRPALEFVKTKPGCSIASSVFFMCLPDQVLVYGDCAVNPNPTAEQLADIAVAAAETAASFDVEPYVAMLSYSTGSSGTGPDVDKVRRATELVKERQPDLMVEGPIQYDAAVDPGVAKTKLPGSKVAGAATVFVFPDLNAGNIAYKAVQRVANATAIGPVMQGLRKPVNDLSRGCTIPDVINTIVITAIQAQRS